MPAAHRKRSKINTPEVGNGYSVVSSPARGTSKAALGAAFILKKGHRDKNTDKNTDQEHWLKVVYEGLQRMKKFVPFKRAKAYYKGGFAYFSYWSEREGKFIRKKVYPNAGHMGEYRKQILDDLVEQLNLAIDQALRKGISFQQEEVRSAATLISHIEDMLKDEDISANLKSLIKSFYRLYLQFLGNEAAPTVQSIDDGHIKAFRAFLIGINYLPKTINNYLGTMQSISDWLFRKKICPVKIETIPFRLSVVKNEAKRFEPFTKEELRKVFSYYKANNPALHLFLMFIHYSCIRPVELHRLQVKHINMKEGTIYTPWYISKNGNSAYVQILQPLHQALQEAGVAQLPGDWYLFGAKCEPSEKPTRGEYYSEQWSRHRHRVGIAANKTPYALKHSFNLLFVEENRKSMTAEKWEWLRTHNRHATVQQTQQYIQSLTANYIDETTVKINDWNIQG